MKKIAKQGDFFSKLGEELGKEEKSIVGSVTKMFGKKPSKQAFDQSKAAVQIMSQNQQVDQNAVVKKPFDIKVYFQAVQLFFTDFFGQKLPYFFKNIGPVMKKFPDWFNKLSQDEKIAYIGVFVSPVFIIVGVVLFFI